MKKADRILAGILFLGALFMLHMTGKLKEPTYHILSNRLFPYVTFTLVMGLSLVLFAGTFAKDRDDDLPEGHWRRAVGRQRITLFALFAAYLFAIPAAGFLPATGGFVVVSSTWLSPNRRRGALVAALTAVGTMGLVYGVFVCWLKSFLP